MKKEELVRVLEKKKESGREKEGPGEGWRNCEGVKKGRIIINKRERTRISLIM